jgi:hypothetical protein
MASGPVDSGWQHRGRALEADELQSLGGRLHASRWRSVGLLNDHSGAATILKTQCDVTVTYMNMGDEFSKRKPWVSLLGHFTTSVSDSFAGCFS